MNSSTDEASSSWPLFRQIFQVNFRTLFTSVCLNVCFGAGIFAQQFQLLPLQLHLPSLVSSATPFTHDNAASFLLHERAANLPSCELIETSPNPDESSPNSLIANTYKYISDIFIHNHAVNNSYQMYLKGLYQPFAYANGTSVIRQSHTMLSNLLHTPFNIRDVLPPSWINPCLMHTHTAPFTCTFALLSIFLSVDLFEYSHSHYYG